ncbi:MAG: hypothetical protein K6B74_08935 [Ruminococcus sp.]|nr:hypothetical protein [Ruminococcus sp.]
MERKLITFITILIVFIGLPYIIYMMYINHQDDLFRTLTEYSSYTTLDKNYDIKVMKYQGVTGGEELYNFKFYIVDNSTDTKYFIKNLNVSAYGTDIQYKEDTELGRYDVKIMIHSASKDEMLTVDLKELRIKGQKVRALF